MCHSAKTGTYLWRYIFFLYSILLCRWQPQPPFQYRCIAEEYIIFSSQWSGLELVQVMVDACSAPSLTETNEFSSLRPVGTDVNLNENAKLFSDEYLWKCRVLNGCSLIPSHIWRNSSVIALKNMVKTGLRKTPWNDKVLILYMILRLYSHSCRASGHRMTGSDGYWGFIVIIWRKRKRPAQYQANGLLEKKTPKTPALA